MTPAAMLIEVARPPRNDYLQLPSQSRFIWDSMPNVRGALDQLELGTFRNAALLHDQMGRDDRIAGVRGTRRDALVGTPVEIKPAFERARPTRIARMLGGYEGEPGAWMEMFPKPTLGQISEWGNGTGIAVAQIVWTTTEKMWTPRLVPWHSQFIRWDWSTQRYLLTTANRGEIPLPDVEADPRSDGQWLVWCPFGYRQAWLGAHVRWLADKYIMRQWDYRDWARYCEVHGSPFIVALVPQSARKEEKDAYVEELADTHGERVVMIEVGEGGPDAGWGVKLIEATGRTFDTFRLFKEALDVDIAVGLLGQNLTTQVDGGSRAAAEVHNLVRIDKLRADAELANCIREQVLTHWARFNFGDAELAPRPYFCVDPPEDEKEEADALTSLGQACVILSTASERVDVDAILEQAGVPMLSPEELAAKRADAAERAADAVASQRALGPGGGEGAGGVQDGGAGADQEPAAGGDPAKLGAKLDVVARYEFQGLPIAVEHRAGSYRSSADADGKETGRTFMLHDYGYIEGVMGADKEELDVYVGGVATASDVHVVHQLRAPAFKSHDEDKTMLGFADAAAAKRAFLAHRNDGERAYGGMSVMPLDRFKAKLQRRTGTGKIRAGAQVLRGDYLRPGVHETAGAMESLLGLLDRAEGMKLAARGRGAGAKRRRLYGDQVADRAIRHAARALAPDLVDVRADIDAAESFEDLRARILKRFKGMDPRKVADVMRKARLMADLGGRAAAIKQIR